MKVVLLQDVKSQGRKGDLVEVSEGYARNFLFPRKLAKEAGTQVLNEIKGKQQAKEYHVSVDIANANQLKEKLENSTLTIQKPYGESEKLYGSVTNKDIADELSKQLHIDVDKRKILLPKAIKDFGEYEITIKLYTDIQAKLKLIVSK